jgi:putative FmdB family regulatory protein
MPIYEYKCNKCGVFEVMQKITEAPLKKCPTCKGKAERQISSTSFVLKGTGWYVTDYARKDSGAAKSESAESANNGSSTAKESASKDTSTTSSTSESATKSTPDKSASTKSNSDKPAAKSAD